MPKIAYRQTARGVNRKTMAAIRHADRIIKDYESQGFSLTVRQLYYQFVAHDLFPDDRRWRWTGSRWIKKDDGTKNATPNYKWLGKILSNARLDGFIDWLAIEDRTRNLRDNQHWTDPHEIVQACAQQFMLDLWEGQESYCEVWIEKDALIGVIEPTCRKLDVPFFSCRGYVSQSAMWRAGQRLQIQETPTPLHGKQRTIIFHLGDHDPSGIDMTRDIYERLGMFGSDVEVIRLGLSMDQVKEHDPPPNPAKETDARFAEYAARFGTDCWELDALEPSVIASLIRGAIEEKVDEDMMDQQRDLQAGHREQIKQVAQNWDDIVENLE